MNAALSRKFALAIACVGLWAGAAHGQAGTMTQPQTALQTVNGVTRPIAGATITVCAQNAGGFPCAPALANAIFKDAGLTQPLSNPFTADANGNYVFAAANGNYTVTVTAPGFAGYSYQVTLAATTTQQVTGVINGDAIPAIDPAYFSLRDDFSSGTTGSGQIGELGWNTNQVFSGTPFYTEGLGAIYGNDLCLANTSTASQTGVLSLFSDGALTGARNGTFPLLGQPGWKLIFIFRFHANSDSNGTPISFAKKTVYVGLAGSSQEIVDHPMTRPALFIGARYDTDTTAPSIADTTIKLEAVANAFSATNARNNAQGTVVDTGITPQPDVYYRLEITCTAAGVFTMSLNGSTPSTFKIPAITYTAGSGSSVNGAITGNNSTIVTMASVTPGPVEFGAGEVLTFAGFTGGLSVLNGTHTVVSLRNSSNTFFTIATTAGVSGSQSGFTATGWPSVFPMFEFGNDSEASPATNTDICANFFSMVWNPGVGGGTGTATATKPRYW